jgi:hypothetical protein
MATKNKRSGFEERMGTILEPAGFEYEVLQVPYKVEHKYTPDWVYDTGRGVLLLVEAKGWFRPGDRLKYKSIRESLWVSGDKELVFLLQYPYKKVQKGSKTTMYEWCDKEGIEWFCTPEELIDYANS